VRNDRSEGTNVLDQMGQRPSRELGTAMRAGQHASHHRRAGPVASDHVPDATFARPDLTTFCHLEELGLEVVGHCLEPDHAVLACRVVDPDQWCRRCGCEGTPRDTVIRRLAHEPLGWRPTTLEVTVRRYRCTGCGHVWCQDTTKAAEPRAMLSRRGLQWALQAIVCQLKLGGAVAGRDGVSVQLLTVPAAPSWRRDMLGHRNRYRLSLLGVSAVLCVQARCLRSSRNSLCR